MIRGSFLLSLSTVIIILFGVLTQYVLAKYFTQSDYGLYQYVLSWISLVGIFALNEFNLVVAKACTQENKGYFKTANKIRLKYSFIGSLVLLFVGLIFKPDLRNYFFIAAFCFPFYMSMNAVQTYLNGLRQFKLSSVLNIISNFVILIGLAYVTIKYCNVFYSLVTVLVLNSLYNGASTVFFHTKEDAQVADDSSLTKYGFQLTGLNLIVDVAKKIQYIILEMYSSTAFLALYFIAQIFPDRLNSILKSFLVPLNVYLSSNKPEIGKRFLTKSFFFFLIFGFVFFISTVLLLPTAIHLVFGEKYDESIQYALLLSIGLIFTPYNLILNKYVIYHGFKKFLLFINISVATFQIILYLILVPKYLIYGIITAILVCQFLSFVINLIWIFNLDLDVDESAKYTFELDSSGRSSKISKINGEKIFGIISSDIVLGDNIPLWAKLIGKLTFTKFHGKLVK